MSNECRFVSDARWIAYDLFARAEVSRWGAAVWAESRWAHFAAVLKKVTRGPLISQAAHRIFLLRQMKHP